MSDKPKEPTFLDLLPEWMHLAIVFSSVLIAPITFFLTMTMASGFNNANSKAVKQQEQIERLTERLSRVEGFHDFMRCDPSRRGESK